MDDKKHEQENPAKRLAGILLFMAGFLMIGVAISGMFD